MAYSRKAIEVTLLPGGQQVHIQVGSYGEDVDVVDLFERDTFRRKQMIRNMRIARSEAGNPGVESIEFRNAVNSTNRGMELANKRYFIHSIVANADGTLTARFSETSNGQFNETITFDPIELDPIDENPITVIRDNIASWLRNENASSLTPAVLAKLNGQRFYA